MAEHIKEESKKEILSSIIKVNKEFIGNSNSIHKLGTNSKKLEQAATNQIQEVLNLKEKEIIYTSGRCESNNLAIYGIVNNYTSDNNIVIAYNDCDSSITETVRKYNGLVIKMAKEIKSLNNVVLVCVSNKNDYNDFIKEHPNYSNHILYDITNSIPLKEDINKYDFISFDLSKYNFYGIGVLIKNTNTKIKPLFKGGKSTTSYRSGTPVLPMIVGFSKFLRILYK